MKMWKILNLLFILICSVSTFAQVPEKINYQAVLRDTQGNVMANVPVDLTVSIVQDSVNGMVVYSESHQAQTNGSGLVNLQIGDGTVLSGSFAETNWAAGTFFIRLESESLAKNRTNLLGTTQLLSVPYALHAKGATNIDDADADPENELQVISISNDTIFLSNGGFAVFPGGYNPGDMRYWDGSGWNIIPAGSPGQVLQLNASGIPQWLGAGYAEVTTLEVTDITPIAAMANGEVAADGGSEVTERGFVYSGEPFPNISDSVAEAGSGTGPFSTTLENLVPGMTYYVRAWAVNSAGLVYGDQQVFATESAWTVGNPGPAGGIVFYDKGYYSDGWRYLEAAPTDQSTDVQWGCSGTNLPGAQGWDFGSGMQNTIDIINGCLTSNIAARIADNFEYGGYSDWFLPSKSSVDEMYHVLYLNGQGSFALDVYWTSTEASSISAWAYNFYSGGPIVNNKVVNYRVRAVRAF